MFGIADPKSLVTVTVSTSNEVTVIGHGMQRKVILTHNKIIIIIIMYSNINDIGASLESDSHWKLKLITLR